MSKKQAVIFIIGCVILSWIFNLFAGRFLTAKISTWPVLNRWQILSPQTPIVINNRETVRVSDGGDLTQAAGSIKSKISTVVIVNTSGDLVEGAAINLTSDGTFVTSAGTFPKDPGNYFVVLNDGISAKISAKILDPATSLVFFKADLNNVPVANLASSKDLNLGEHVLITHNSLISFNNKIYEALVSSVQSDIQGQVILTDYPRRSFLAPVMSALVSGEVFANSNSDVVGIWNGSTIISSDVLRQAMKLYFSDNQKITRASFGFSYYLITKDESGLTGQVEGVYVKDLTGAPARLAGLASGDIITQVDGVAINEGSQLEEVLQNYKPGDKLTLSVVRKTQNLKLILTAGELH